MPDRKYNVRPLVARSALEQRARASFFVPLTLLLASFNVFLFQQPGGCEHMAKECASVGRVCFLANIRFARRKMCLFRERICTRSLLLVFSFFFFFNLPTFFLHFFPAAPEVCFRDGLTDGIFVAPLCTIFIDQREEIARNNGNYTIGPVNLSHSDYVRCFPLFSFPKRVVNFVRNI